MMTDRPPLLSMQFPLPSQNTPAHPPGPTVKDEVTKKAETVEEEPYTIKCICNFSDDDGNTILCETCDTWQHIDCFYPDSRDEALRPDFIHSCADCKPRPLPREKAIERALQLKNPALSNEHTEKKPRRPPSKSHKKKPKLNDGLLNSSGSSENGKHGSPSDHPPPAKKAKTSHRPSQSISSQPSKRSPSYGNARSNLARPTSPADLPDDFRIHHYSQGFFSLYNEHKVPETQSNSFPSLAIPTALSRWLREPEAMIKEVGRTHSEVFQSEPSNAPKPTIEVQDATRSVGADTVVRWRFLRSTTAAEKDVPLIELNGEVGFQKDYCADPGNLWGDLSSPLPFVFFHPVLPLYIDTRKEGSLARYVRRSCKPNAQLDTYLSGGSEYHFWLVSDRSIAADEQITLPWDFRLEKSVKPRWLHLLGLSDEASAGRNESEMAESEYGAITNWIDRILSEYGGCACDLENNCAFARFHRHYLHGKHQARPSATKKKPRKPRTHTVSPVSTGPATNSRAASEGHGEDGLDNDGRSQSGSSHSKPPSRDPTPLRQGSFDQLGILTEPTDRDKRKVKMVEDSFRRMEQQQPQRKKKRVSDGTASNSTKSKQRNGSVTSQGQYVDHGTSHSKTGSPTIAPSPQFTSKPFTSRQQSVANLSRESSTKPRPVYCDVGIQTDPVQGEWYSTVTSPRPRKKIIPLSRRLLSSKHRLRLDEEEQRKRLAASRASSGLAMEVDSLSAGSQPTAVAGDIAGSPTTHTEDVSMQDVSAGPISAISDTSVTSSMKTKTPDLRVLMPPVPTFDCSSVGPTNPSAPMSALSTATPSPFSAGTLSTPFGSTINGVSTLPSPAKKKLSLSDYTRRSKAAGKVAGGSGVLKPILPSPEESKVDIVHEPQEIGKPEKNNADETATTTLTNGHL